MYRCGHAEPQRTDLGVTRPRRSSSVFDGHHGPRRLPRKEVIQPQLPLRLPCYDFVPVTAPTLGACPHRLRGSWRSDFRC